MKEVFLVVDQGKDAYRRLDEFILQKKIKPLVTNELIEEHRRNSIGKHSPNLMKVLNYLRRHHEEIENKYLIINIEPHRKWCIGQHPGERGKGYTIFTDEFFDSREDAEHGLFVKRLKKQKLMN